jgi:hypothetical protein
VDEGKRVTISFLRVTGILLIGFPIYIYFINQKGLFAILPLVLFTVIIGIVFLVISTVIWKKEHDKNLGSKRLNFSNVNVLIQSDFSSKTGGFTITN